MMKKLKIYLTIIMLSLGSVITNAQSNDSIEVQLSTTIKELSVRNHQLTGKATYYGLHYKTGRKTASGKPYDKNKLTAAHKTLPFGTIVLVTNKTNGKSVQVEITDRGPFGPGRVIDLSVAAAKELNMLKAGVVPATIKVLSMPITKKNRKK